MLVRMHGLFGQNKQEIADGCPNAWLIRTGSGRKLLMVVRMYGLFGQKKQEMADDCPNHGLFGQNKQEIADGCPNGIEINIEFNI
jgi:hypothetical protein